MRKSGTLLFANPTRPSTKGPVALVTSNQQGVSLDLSANPQLGILTGLQGGRALFGASARDTWIRRGS